MNEKPLETIIIWYDGKKKRRSKSMQSITKTVYQMFIKMWYKYGLNVSFLTIDNHKKIVNKYKYKPFF